MKQKQLPKSAFLLLLSLSFGAFLYVNADACCQQQPGGIEKPLVEAVVESDEFDHQEERKVPVPAISVLSKIVDVVQKFASVAPK
jgi:hypothetical protein